ncbi:GNAT family protein [uncultured Psychroserpens sp.]|uniref:GNAT family N-acetyltransferase n=1 Tax=uncultured Psychroserpens sp. TaxID=255436 RepID=UPI0026140B53|nr:GNAT family protein [uncultured Psychroserpens sp.]
MSNNRFHVREMTIDDLEHFINYWLEATPEFLSKMGVDVDKRPQRDALFKLVVDQFKVPLELRKNYFLFWLLDDKPVGYSNINQIEFSKQAFMHLHLWQPENRQRGLGMTFIKKSLPFYFENFKLKSLLCEPYALNPAPNRVVEKIGFQFVKTYRTIPGASNFEQFVSQWKLSKAAFEKIIES